MIIFFQHHCRKCGGVVCGPCSNKRFLLPNQSLKPLRVCLQCYDKLSTRAKSLESGGLNNDTKSHHHHMDKDRSGSAESSFEEDSDEDEDGVRTQGDAYDEVMLTYHQIIKLFAT